MYADTSLKTAETLLGIETERLRLHSSRPQVSQNCWNPFRDWNKKQIAKNEGKNIVESQNCWNPFRDWNSLQCSQRFTPSRSQNCWNPFRDWNGALQGGLRFLTPRLKTAETLLGIETFVEEFPRRGHNSLKTAETLLGIETLLMARLNPSIPREAVSKLLKPF